MKDELVHMTEKATMPIYGKTFKTRLLQNQWTDGLGTLYVALGTFSNNDLV